MRPLTWWHRLRRCLGMAAPSFGRRGEAAAADYLRGLGYRIVEIGRRFRFGELDLVAVDGETIVFVEVKTRTSDARGTPAAAVDRGKRERLTRAALAYLKSRRLLDRRTRFDVVAVVWPNESSPPAIEHFRGAFEAAGPRGMYS